MNTTHIAEILEALSSPIRLGVLLCLIRAGETGLVAGEISDLVEVSPTNLSFHLRALTRSALVVVTQEGRFLRYRADFKQVSALVDGLVDELGKPAAKILRSAERQGKR